PPAPHAAEVYRRLADVHFDRTEYARAAAVLRRALARFPLAPEAPELADRVVLCGERARDDAERDRATPALLRDYLADGAWARPNADRPEALARARTLVGDALARHATHHHAAAQALRQLAVSSSPDGRTPDATAIVRARAEYAVAAQAYAEHLARFPE